MRSREAELHVVDSAHSRDKAKVQGQSVDIGRNGILKSFNSTWVTVAGKPRRNGDRSLQ